MLPRFLSVLGGAVLLAATVGFSQEPAARKKANDPSQIPENTEPRWLWLGPDAKDGQTVHFRKAFDVRVNLTAARLYAVCDNEFTLYLDGREVLKQEGWETVAFKDVTEFLVAKPETAPMRRHVLAVRAKNHSGPAGLLVRLELEPRSGKPYAVATTATWKASEKADKDAAGRAWTEVLYDDASWSAPKVVGKLGDAPWDVVNATSLARASRLREPSATPPDQIKVAKDFRVELLYSVPKDTQGSWVNLCVDPKGRLITSDQYGPLYRVTPPPLGGWPEQTRVERLDAKLGEAQGLLWAFDSLYVVVNRGEKYDSGLYRVRSSKGDDRLDEVTLLRKIEGGGEHGPHAVLLGPDRKSLYIVCGNGTQQVAVDSSRVPKVWGEDHLLPRLPDGNGFMRGVLGPGGSIYRTDPDGKRWELVSTGYRNQFDAAFNRHGDLFTYDADMEWDLNTPWYRPTRICLAASGSEFGWRNGAGKWPAYYPDSLPAVVDIGPGSPTGITFGYGAKFPAKYREALFICDWSYGKLYAVHLTPDGAAYRGDAEEFLSGSPLPLTDAVVHPGDGSLYFAIGGRRTKSGLYRVTYVGKESTAPATPAADAGAAPRELRRRLEAFHGRPDPSAVEAAWPHLGHADRYIRFAARVALEHQDVASWRSRALEERNPRTALTALLALVRTSAADPFHRKPGAPQPEAALRGQVLDALARLGWDRLNDDERLDLLRAYAVTFNRLGRPDESARRRVINALDPHFPTRRREVNAELCQMLVYLEAPSVAAKTLRLMATAPTQEEQIDYARALRVLKAGWTPALRAEYFRWFLRAGSFKGGSSFGGFVRNIQADAVATLTEREKAELKPILEAKPEPRTAVAVATRPVVKQWTVADLAPALERALKGGRDYDRGRILFGQANCFSCHRFAGEGGASGPDLTGAGGRFSSRDLLESVVEPNKEISDQYGAVVITTTTAKIVTGRIVNLGGDAIMVNTDLTDPNAIATVDRKQVETLEKSKVSMMPSGLLDTLQEEEVLDLMAYLLSRGDRGHPAFRK